MIHISTEPCISQELSNLADMDHHVPENMERGAYQLSLKKIFEQGSTFQRLACSLEKPSLHQRVKVATPSDVSLRNDKEKYKKYLLDRKRQQKEKILQKISHDLLHGSRKAANQVSHSPGNYDPAELLLAATLFLRKKSKVQAMLRDAREQEEDFKKAAVLLAGSLCRAEIDFRLHQNQIPEMFALPQEWYHLLFDQYKQLTKKEREMLSSYLREAVKGFEEWDRKTPREYDPEWIVSIQQEENNPSPPKKELDPKEKQAIIDQFYRELRGEAYLSQDTKRASPTDPCFFEPTSRKFSHKNSGIFCILPKEIHPVLDRLGKYTSSFTIPKTQSRILIELQEDDFEWHSLDDSNFIAMDPILTFLKKYALCSPLREMFFFKNEEDKSKQQSLPNDPSDTMKKYSIHGIDIYKQRLCHKNSQIITHCCRFTIDQYSFVCTLYTNQKKEQESLQYFEEMIQSIGWTTPSLKLLPSTLAYT